MPGIFKAPPLPVLFTMCGMVRCDWLSRYRILQRKETGVCCGLGKKRKKHDRITWQMLHFA